MESEFKSNPLFPIVRLFPTFRLADSTALVWRGPLYLGTAKDPHIGPHISVILVLKQVLEEVVVGSGFLEVWELSGPSNHFLLARKKHTGSGPILSTLERLEGNQQIGRAGSNKLALIF